MCVIYSYTREQALNDGVLVDVTQLAKEAGLAYPTAVTSAVWGRYVEVPDGVPCQDETGRLWDILWMLQMQIQKSNPKTQVEFELYVRSLVTEEFPITLKAILGPGDQGEPVITIMLPDED